MESAALGIEVQIVLGSREDCQVREVWEVVKPNEETALE
jgi:hypothetical protein